MWQLMWILASISISTGLVVWSARAAQWGVPLAVLVAAGIALGMLIAVVVYGLTRGVGRRRRRIFRRKSGRLL